MGIKEELGRVIEQVQLNEQDVELWRVFIDVNEEAILSGILELLKENPGSLSFLTNNLKVKVDAFSDRDVNKLNSIIKSEMEVIRSLGQ